MNEYVDDGAKGRAWLDDENVQTTSYAHITELEDGSFREQGEGAQYSEVFWSDAVTTTLHQTHPRVSSLKTQLVCQYKFENGRIYVKTLRYHMTTRSGNWYRANIDVGLQAGEWVRLNSPDSMSQDDKWHDYVVCLDSLLGAPDFGVSLTIRVDYDGTNNDVEPHEGWGTDVFPSQKPIIEVPAPGAVVEMPFSVSGGNGLYGNGAKVNLLCLYSGNVTLLRSATVGRDGRWNASISLPPGVSSFYAKQIIGSETSGSSNIVTIKRSVAAPQITKPSSNETVDPRPTISGTGVSGSTVKVWQTNPYRVLVTGTQVGANLNWSKQSEVALESPSVTIRAQATLDGVSSPETENRTFIVRLNSLSITSPAAGSLQNQTFTLSGTGGEAGAIARVFLDLNDTPVGASETLTGDQWSASVTVPVGPASVVAQNFKGQLESPRSTPRHFKIRPPKFSSFTACPADDNTVTFSGNGGYVGEVPAYIEITFTSPELAPIELPVQTSSWTYTSANWVPGNYTCQARQWVCGASAGEKIYSEATAPFSFSISVPTPTLTFHVGEDQRPKFSGTGHHWDNQPDTQVEVSGGTSPVPKTPVILGQWSAEASVPWAPGSHSVKARQLFQASGSPELASAWTEPVSVVVRPRLPTIDTIDEDGLFPIFSGTCWPGAEVNFVFSDGGPSGSATDSDKDGRWTFTRSQLSLPGAHTVTATQTFGGQTSNPASKSFSVAVVKPVITPITVPVGHQDSVIEGHSGVPGAVMKIYDQRTEEYLGEAPVTEGKWAVIIDELAFGPSDIYARQTFNQTHSAHSQHVRLEVTLLAPVVQTPLPDDTVARRFRIQGRGARPKGSDAAYVYVWLNDAPDPWDVRVVWNTGHWEFDAVLPVGAHTLTFQQYFRDHKSVCEELVLAVVPAKPFIETPASGETIEAHMAVFGFGYPGDTVSLAFADAIEVPLGTAQVQEDGTWSLRLPLDRPAGQAALLAQQRYGEHLSGWTEARALELRSDPPLFTTPRSGRWILPQPVFAGTAEKGSAVALFAWFDPELKLGEAPFTGQSWEATPSQAVRSEEHWVRAQTSGGTQTSAMADSPRFEVIAVAPEAARSGV
ncbi:hypothetical protein [Pseudomonas sp. B21-048]|uniref:hypothetical protein n=1 Tax=Pseudomonas sp. B21-048 TaxID=2895490 RepID=UPI00215EE1C7|nr:hypothetical protein [Pseudomonas sp. B21-048]UVK97662.1 hypothetical protein LOY56_20325 [Pseudomonas sp. B21-048]